MAGPNPSLEMASRGSVSPTQIVFQDPNMFVAREIHRHLPPFCSAFLTGHSQFGAESEKWSRLIS